MSSDGLCSARYNANGIQSVWLNITRAMTRSGGTHYVTQKYRLG